MDTGLSLPLLLLLTAATASAVSFRYKTAGNWHSSSDHQGRIDLLGIDELKLLTTSVTECSDGLRGLYGWIHGTLLCQDLLKSSVVVHCRPNQGITEPQNNRKALRRLELLCQDESGQHHVSLKAALTCEGYNYPTDILRDSRSCRLEVTTRAPVEYLTCEIIQIASATSYLLWHLIVVCIRCKNLSWFKFRRKAFFCAVMYFSWLPLQAVVYTTDSIVRTVLLVIFWNCIAVIYLGWSVHTMH